MENKLYSLKDGFCKFYCETKHKRIYKECSPRVCECGNVLVCNGNEGYVNLCNECPVDNFIKYIRDDLR